MKPKLRETAVRHPERHYTVILERDKPGYHAFCPALPGCQSKGKTLDAAMRNVRKAARSYCKRLLDNGESPPEENILFGWVTYAARSSGAKNH